MKSSASEETVLHRRDVPIYDELARLWRAAGRTVPGQADPVWESLTASRSAGRHRPRGEERTAGDRPGRDGPGRGRPVDDRLAGVRPGGGRPGSEQPAGGRPDAEQPAQGRGTQPGEQPAEGRGRQPGNGPSGKDGGKGGA